MRALLALTLLAAAVITGLTSLASADAPDAEGLADQQRLELVEAICAIKSEIVDIGCVEAANRVRLDGLLDESYSTLGRTGTYDLIQRIQHCLERAQNEPENAFTSYQAAYVLLDIALLHLAAQLGDPGLLDQELAETSAAVNAGDFKSWTALHYAADCGQVAAARRLLELGADVEASTWLGDTPLHVAAASGSLDGAQLLLEAGADLTARNNQGCQPLHEAARAGKLAMVKFLVAAGADPDALSDGGCTPRELALAIFRPVFASGWTNPSREVYEQHRQIAKYLEQYLDKEQLTKDLLEAVKLDDAQACALILDEIGGPSNWTPPKYALAWWKNGDTLLHWAAMYGHREVAPLLIAAGAEVNAVRDHDGATPMHVAAGADNLAVMQLLIEAGADVNIRPRYYGSALHVAAWGNYPDMVQLLARAEADLEARDEDGNTPLFYTCRSDGVEAARALLAAGADLGARDNDGKTLLHAAAAGQNPRLLTLLLELGMDVKARDNRGFTPLLYATGLYDQQHLELLLATGADVNESSNSGETPLHVAAKYDSVEIIPFLLESGANVNAGMANGRTPLYEAASENQLAAAQLLLDAGADVNALDDFGQTPIFGAAEYGHPQMIRLLLRHGALGNIVDEHGKSPRDIALENFSPGEHLVGINRPQAARMLNSAPPICTSTAGLTRYPGNYLGSAAWVRELIESGQDVNPLEYKGKPPLSHVMSNSCVPDQAEAARLLLAAGADPNWRDLENKDEYLRSRTYLHAAVFYSPTIVPLLIAAGADVNVVDCYGRTPLFCADAVAAAQALLDAGAEVNCQNLAGGRSPLFSYDVLHNPAVLALLLDNGADIFVRSSAGSTPLHYAAATTSTESVRLLLEAGIDPTLTDEKGLTAYDIAVEKKRWANMGLLWQAMHADRY
jgi:ankyrin repeat protein